MGKPIEHPVSTMAPLQTVHLHACHLRHPAEEASHCVPLLQLPEQDELLWDDGSAQPEWCLDQFTLVGRVSAEPS